MLIQDIMQRRVVTTAPETHLAAAYRLMQEHDIRHLPVVEGTRLVGVVTDRDLRFLTRKLVATPFHDDDRVADLMTPHPVTAGPLDPVEEAARLMRARKIGCLPVVEGAALVGIVTVTDLLDAVIRLTGVGRPSGRLAVRLDDEPGRLARLTALVAKHDVNIHSVLSYFEDDRVHLRLILRVDTLHTHPLAETLRRAGFDVVWPVEKPGGGGS